MRKLHLKYCFLLFATITAASIHAQRKADVRHALPSQFRLLPVPQNIQKTGEGTIPASALTSVYAEAGISMPPVQQLLVLKTATKPGQGVITLRKSDTIKNKEAYVLELRNGQAHITAGHDAGFLYGVQTLMQLIEDAKDQKVPLPSVRISDHPDVAYRAIHLDLKHHLDSLSYYYSMMDRLAALKVNAVILEFEDKLKYKGAPTVGASHAISVEEFAKLSDYAKARNIEISPLIQGLGHASFILKHQQYKTLRDDTASDWSFDPLNPKTYELQFSLYDDAIAATPHGRYLHVGGDEVGKLGMSELAKKSGMKPIELQMTWLRKVCDYAQQHNRIPVFWDDMLFKLSGLYETTYDASIPAEEVEKRWKEKESLLNENVHLFPKNCVYMRWNYDNPRLPGNLKALQWYEKNNLAVMAATAGQQIWPLLPRANSNFQPVKDFSRMTAENNLVGILLTLWDDASPHFETYWRGIHNYALFTWNYVDVDRDRAHAMFRHRFYGPALFDKQYAFQDTLEQAVQFWETALINKGYRETYPPSIDTLTLPHPDSAGTWSKRNSARLAAARKELRRYDETKKKIAKAMSVAKRNKYSLEIFNQINELQIYPADLLLKLERYDLAGNGNEKKSAARDVRSYVDSFSRLREQYEQVFTKTRVLQNPADYVADQNHHHHLANGTVNNNWMYVYELALNEKIKNQLTE